MHANFYGRSAFFFGFWVGIGLLAAPRTGWAQAALQPGFTLLETGKFAEGAAFFRHYLRTTADSSNRTALLCYGRGIGLSGNVPEAQQVFKRLQGRFPTDFEIGLNWAESLMWAKDYAAARSYYEKLLAEKPNSFPATLGYANALSSLQNYLQALAAVEQALVLLPGNANARLSRKYIRLGLADKYQKNQQYTETAPLLEAILRDYPGDKDALFAKARLLSVQARHAESAAIYSVLAWQPDTRSEAYRELAYLAFLQGQKAQSLTYAQQATVAARPYPEQVLKAQLSVVNALGWNKRYAEAFARLDSLAPNYPNTLDIDLTRAALLVWSRHYAKGAALYELALQQKPNSFDGNLGYANARHAEGNDAEAYRSARKLLTFYPNQVDAVRFIERLDLLHKPTLTAHTYLSRDNGNNVSMNYALTGAADIQTNLRLSVSYKDRRVGTVGEAGMASAQVLLVGLKTRLLPFWVLTTQAGGASLRYKQTHQQVVGSVVNEFRLGRFQTADLRYTRDVQNFTAGLVGSNLVYESLVGTYNLSTPAKLGVYSQYLHAFFSDGNQQQSLYTSVYYDVSAEPVLKTGLNVQVMRFAQQRPITYFSPSRFLSAEAFVQAENIDLPKLGLLYQGMLAGGAQRIEQEAWQPTYRVSLGVGYRPMKTMEFLVYGLTSNSATSSVTGYTYSEAGLKLKWVVF